ncbi:hypothetical protein PENTCL1PPCAC_27210, partial [Pristionchus entomophagus]
HPEEARAGVAKLSSGAQQPAGEIIKIFVSDKDPKTKYEEIQNIKAGLSSSVRAEIDNHKTDLAHKIGILTLHEILERLENLAAHIKAHPDEARAGVAKLSAAAQKPAGEIIKIFVSDKDAKTKYEEIQKIKADLPASVRAEIDNHKTELAHKIGILTLHEIIARLEKLAEHIKAHPEEARAGVAKLSAAAQKPAGEIIKIFVSDKDAKTKYEEIHNIKAALPASVRAEIDNHKTELAHKIGILTLHEILARLEKFAEHIKVKLYGSFISNHFRLIPRRPAPELPSSLLPPRSPLERSSTSSSPTRLPVRSTSRSRRSRTPSPLRSSERLTPTRRSSPR